jgi:polyferredoxin
MTDNRTDLLTAFPGLKSLIRSRLWQPAGMVVTLFLFVLAILTGILGTPAGSRNFGIIFVWIVWWGLLIIGIVPLFGRGWCAVCPIPAPGEWWQRRSIAGFVPGRTRSLGWRWPRRLRNIWLQNGAFLLVALFSAVILTVPAVSGWLLLGFLLLGVLLSCLFDGRIFCRFLCPVGGFIGLYALTSPLELRVKDVQVCREHRDKECVVGSACGYGCPWLVYPGNLQRNAYCGLCGECLRSCTRDNIALNLRRFGTDLMVAGERRLDEAYKSFIMLSCALVYSAVLIGPWSWVKDMAGMRDLGQWALYAAGFLALNLVVVPGVFLLVALISRRLGRFAAPPRRVWVDYAYALVPLSLAGWIAFSLSFVLVNGSYAPAVLSDPFGWGWNLLGTADYPWQPLLLGALPWAQVGALLLGLAFAIKVVYGISQQHLPSGAAGQRALLAALPVVGFSTGVTILFLRLMLG